MRRHVKASLAHPEARDRGSTPTGGRKARGLFGLLCLFVLGLTAFLGTGAPVAGADEGEGCPNASLRTGASENLPDCRAAELVSPQDKNMGDMTRVLRASDDGGTVAFGVNGGFSGANAAHNVSFGVARRSPTGWTVEPADAPGVSFPFGSSPQSLLPFDFDATFSTAVDQSDAALVPEDTTAGYALYRVPVGAGVATWLDQPQGAPVSSSAVPDYGAASDDLSRIFFTERNTDSSTPAELVPGAPDNALYEWRDGTLRVVSRLPDGTLSPGFVVVAAGDRSAIGGGGTSGIGVAHRGAHAVSDDGSSVFWRPLSTHPTALYLSRDGMQTRAVTTEQADFIGATHDHSFAYLASKGQLTPDATAGNELYRYDTTSGTFTLLTPNSAGGTGAEVVGAIASDDMTHVYFTAYGALTPEAQSGSLNAYVWSDGHVRFIATFDDPGSAVMRVSDDGGYALVASKSSLAGAASDGHQEVYAYNAASGALSCVSCRSDGAPSGADSTLGELISSVPIIGNSPSGLQRVRNITDDGRVFFMSFDALVPADINGKQDVYEWSPDGHLALLSDGRSEFDSYLGDNSDNGRDVFILTRSRMTSADTDDLYDVYDLRVGGGFAESGAAPCLEDDCQGLGSTGPRIIAPGTRGAAPRSARQQVKLFRLSRRARTALAHKGSARLALRVAGGGRVVVRGRATIDGRTVLLARGDRTVRTASVSIIHVLVRMSARGRRLLAERGRLVLTFTASLHGAPPGRARTTLTTTQAPR